MSLATAEARPDHPRAVTAERHQAYRCPRCGRPTLFATFAGQGAGADTLTPEAWRFVEAGCAMGCALTEAELPRDLVARRSRHRA